MVKKLFTLFVTLIVLITAFTYPVFGTENNENEVAGPGGLDFYSITIHYDAPTVVSYKYITRTESQKDDLIYYYSSKGKKTYKEGYVFGDPVDKFVLHAGDNKDTYNVMYKKKYSKAERNFVGLFNDDFKHNAQYSTFPYKYAYATNIQNDQTIMSSSSILLRGLTAISDDAGRVNPNVVVRDDGYIQTADGKYKIDINGYLLYENDEWRAVDGNVIALFKKDENGKLVPMDRYDETTGRIRFLNNTTEGFLYKVKDNNGDGQYDESEIMVNNEKDKFKLYGEPVNGIPATKSKITGISIEIDALGDQIYTDLSKDPQQLNEIILTFDDWYEQILVDQEHAEKDKAGNIKNPEGIKGKIIGTVKSKTTKTEANFTDTSKTTFQSIYFDLSEDMINSFKEKADFYLTFKVKTQQPAAAYNADKTDDMEKIFVEVVIPPKPPVPKTKTFIDKLKDFFSNTTNIIIVAVVGVVVIAGVVILIVLKGKKKGSKESVEVTDDTNKKVE